MPNRLITKNDKTAALIMKALSIPRVERSREMKVIVLTAFLFCMLCWVISMQRFVPPKHVNVNIGDALDLFVPRTLDGWDVKDILLGDTEFGVKAVLSVLNCDSYVYREFTKGEISFSVYFVYWRAGQAPIQSVATHSPENCWVQNGWKCLEWKDNFSLGPKDMSAVPGSWRRFLSPSKHYFDVQYWHVVAGKVHNFGYRQNVSTYAFNWVRDGTGQMINGLPEQYFIRIVSRRPLGELLGDTGFSGIMKRLMGVLSGEIGDT